MPLLPLFSGLFVFLAGLQQLTEALAALRAPLQRRLPPPGRFACPPGYLAAGALLAAVGQTSSSVILFAMAGADSGLFTLGQAFALVLGANLGTSSTGYLLLAGMADTPALPCFCLGAGLVLQLGAGRRPRRAAGQALLALGLLLTGLNSAKTALLPLLSGGGALREGLAQSAAAAFLSGLLAALFLQSSSAALGLLQSLCAAQPLALCRALPAILGMNIGTCSTLLAAAAAFRAPGRRVALFHLGFNALGSLGAMLLLPLLPRAAAQLPVTPLGAALLQTTFNGAALLPAFLLCNLWLPGRAATPGTFSPPESGAAGRRWQRTPRTPAPPAPAPRASR